MQLTPIPPHQPPAHAGVSPPAPSLFSRTGALVGGVLGAPRSAVRQVTKRLGRAQRLWWRLEDVVVDGSKLALRLAVKAARPVLVGAWQRQGREEGRWKGREGREGRGGGHRVSVW